MPSPFTETPAVVIAADDRTGALEVAGVIAAEGAGPVRVAPLATLGAMLVAAHRAGTRAGDRGGDDAGDVVGDHAGIVVVDLGTRHLEAHVAARAAAQVDELSLGGARGAPVGLHKIDSTLRGNWAHELVARSAGRRAPVLLVPALPALGRRCIAGEVREHGRPVAEATGAIDARGTVVSSRPADLLRAAGAGEVDEVAPGPSLRAWLERAWAERDRDRGAGRSGSDVRERVAVCDATSDADLAAIASQWAPWARDVLLAGTSSSIGAGVVALGLPPRSPGDQPPGVLARPWVVVAGSLHPATAAQLDELAAAGAHVVVLDGGADEDATARMAIAEHVRTAGVDGVLILRCRRPDASRVSAASAEAAAATLARAAWTACDAARACGRPVRTLVVVGGDTAAAVLGEGGVDVRGTVAAGMPWGGLDAQRLTSTGVRGAPAVVTDAGAADDLVLVTKAGGFGGPETLVRLLPERNVR